MASAFLTGFAQHRGGGRQSYQILTHVIPMSDDGLAGGAAAFGAMDSGEVLLLTHAPYVPSIRPAQARRAVRTPEPPLDAAELPRFVMVCAWPLPDGKDGKPGKPLAGYAERDDANMSARKEKFSSGLTAHWLSVPAQRAQARFAQKDWCGEVASGKPSSAPKWLLDGESR